MPYKVSNLNGTFQQQYEADPRIVAALAARQQADQVPIYSPGQGVARALSKMLDAYNQKQIQGEYQQKQTDQNGALADALAPPTDNPGLQAPPVQLPTTSTPVDNGALGQGNIQTGGGQIDASVPDYQTENPNRSKISALLNSGLISQDNPSVASALMKSAGLGEPQAPTKLGPGDVLLGPDNKTPLYSAPFKPDAAPKPEADPEIVRTAKYLFPDDMKAQSDYIKKNSRASTVNITTPKQNWQILTDPKSQTQYRYDLDSGKAFSLDGQPYTPGGAQKMGSGSVGRSPAAMYLQKYQQEHPQATSSELADVAATFGAQQKAVKDFATGPEGNIITRINTAVSHLDTLQKVGEALDNGDVQAFNKLRNIWRTQFGSELPTNFNAAMPIVAGEVSKAVVGTQGGTREDRAELEASLQDAASKKQLGGATGTQKSLLQGQLQSRRRQYETSTGRKDFDKFLSGDTQRELGISTDSASPDKGGPPQIKSDADYNKLPSGTVFIDPDGKQRRKP